MGSPGAHFGSKLGSTKGLTPCILKKNNIKIIFQILKPKCQILCANATPVTLELPACPTILFNKSEDNVH